MGTDNITLGEGTLYINGHLLGTVSECSLEPTEELPILGETPKIIAPTSEEVTFTINMSMDEFAECFSYWRLCTIIKAAPARLRHLTLNGKKLRTRKKNLGRILRDYAKKEDNGCARNN